MMKFLRTQMKWIMAVIAVAFLLSTFLMYEGRGTRRTPGRNPDGSMSDYEVAQINGRSLMRSELEQRLRNYLSNYSSRSAESLDMPAIYQAVLDQAVLESQLAKEIDEKGIRISDAQADAAMKNYADTYYPTREAFYQALANSGVKVEDYKRTLAHQMAVDQLLRDAVGEVEVSEDRAVEFYDTMKTLIYSRPEGFMIHMADFNTSDDAEAMREKISSGESWDVIASSDLFASKDVINITKAPVFLPNSALRTGALSVLGSLDIGQVSPVFSVSSYDFAVAMKTEHVDETVTPYDEVSADIRTLLTQQEQRRRLNEFEKSLRDKAQLVINDEELFARPVVSEDNTPELSLDDISTDTTAPSIILEEVSEEVKEEVKSEVSDTVSEEAKPEEPAAESEPEPKPETTSEAVETPKTEATSEPETPKTDEAAVTETVTAPEATEPAKNDEATELETPKADDNTAAVEEVKTEAASEPEAPVTETTSEPAKADEATEPEAPKTDEAPAAETVTAPETTEPAKNDETPEPEAPKANEAPITEAAPEVPAVVEEVKAEEVITKSEDIPLQEEVKELTEAVTENISSLSEEVKEAAE